MNPRKKNRQKKRLSKKSGHDATGTPELHHESYLADSPLTQQSRKIANAILASLREVVHVASGGYKAPEGAGFFTVAGTHFFL